MRVNNKGGVPPRDRRLDRRKVASVALAAILLVATTGTAKAVTVWNIVEGLSSMTIGQDIDLSALALGIVSVVEQAPGSLTAPIYGNLVGDISGGSISFGGGSEVNYRPTGTYAPADPITSDPPFPPVGVTPDANYGLFVGAPLGLTQVQYNMEADLIVAPTALSGGTSGTFAFSPGADFLVGTDGRLAFTSVIGSDTGDMIGDPFAALGTFGVTPGEWDPSDPTAGPEGTLTIPIESAFTTELDAEGTPITVTFFASGVIVATPAPEPSSLVLLGVGALGLFACGWRLRKRRA